MIDPRKQLTVSLLFCPDYRMNPWLTYGEPLHRLREFGVTAKEMDMIDEAKLSAEQMKYLCSAM